MTTKRPPHVVTLRRCENRDCSIAVQYMRGGCVVQGYKNKKLVWETNFDSGVPVRIRTALITEAMKGEW